MNDIHSNSLETNMLLHIKKRALIVASTALISVSACSSTVQSQNLEKADGTNQDFSHTMTTSASAETIFSLWTSPETWKDWDKGLKSASLDGNFAPGVQGIIEPLSGPDSTFTVVEVIDNERAVFQTDLPFAKLTVSRSIEQGIDVQNNIAITHDIKFEGALGWMWGSMLGGDFRTMLIPTMKKLVDIAEGNQQHLSETSYLNFSHPTVQIAITDATRNASSPKEKAIAIHDYVRDEIVFGFSSDFYDMSASDVLAEGRGFCNNQSTVFAAMLRGAGIPARHRFYSLSAQVLEGIINPGTEYVDHAVVEAFIEDNWVPVDSYIVDSQHARAVQPLLESGLGMGMRADASLKWDGLSASFSQFHPDYIEKDFGIYEDVGEFYDRVEDANNRFGTVQKLMFPLAISSANDRVAQLRSVDL